MHRIQDGNEINCPETTITSVQLHPHYAVASYQNHLVAVDCLKLFF